MIPISIRGLRVRVYTWTAIWFIVFAAAGAACRVTPWSAAAFRQLAVLALFFGAAISLPGIAAHIASFSRGQRLVLGGFLGLVLLSHVTERNLQTYPFVSWYMYTEIEPAPTYYPDLNLWGYTASGERVPVRYKRVAPGLQLTIMHSLEDLTARYDTAAETDRVRIKKRIRNTLLIMAARYNEQHPKLQIDAIVFEAYSVSIDWRNGTLTKTLAHEWREPLNEVAR